MTIDPSNATRQGRRLRPYSALPQGWLRRSEAMRLTDKAKLLFWAMTDHGCEQLTDGRIEVVVLPMLYAVTGADASALAELAKGEIVKRVGVDYQLVDFLEYSRSREDRESARTAAREKKRQQRKSDVPRDVPPSVPPPVPPSVPRDTSGDSLAQRERERETLEGSLESTQLNGPDLVVPGQAVAVTLNGRDGDEDVLDRGHDDKLDAAPPSSPEIVEQEPVLDQDVRDVRPTPPARFVDGDLVETELGSGEVTSELTDDRYMVFLGDGSCVVFSARELKPLLAEVVT